MSLERLLVRVPGVYADLVDAALPTRGGEPGDAPDPREKPAPGNLAVMELRHKLVRGLRWWVDAVENDSRARVGQSVAAMCALLLARLDVLADEDKAELSGNLNEWLSEAWGFMGDPEPQSQRSPDGQCVYAHGMHACGAMLPVAEAVRILGVPVSTLKDRVPTGPDRQGGRVRVGAVVRSGCLG